jgi:hypothetical protein
MDWSDAQVLLFAAVLLAFGLWPGVLRAAAEALENFRGGPPTGMHPSPADDSALLRRRSRP